MSRKWIVALFLSIMTFAFADQHRDDPILYYSDDCDIKILPNAGPRIRGNSWNVFLTADFIYWTARTEGLDYAVSGVGSNNASGRVHDLDWSWDPGFKVGLGVNLTHDGWDLFAQYTWLHSDAADSTSQDTATTNLTPYWATHGVLGSSLTHAKANWDVKFHNLTWELGRNAYMSQFMKLRLFGGLCAAWVYQDYDVSYTNTNGEISCQDMELDYWGVGLRAGLNNSFQFSKSFSLYSDIALALLWGQFDRDRKEKQTDANNVTVPVVSTDQKPHSSQPVISLGAGLRYDAWLSQNRFHLGLQAGWEHQNWILFNHFITLPGDPNHQGDFFLQGFTLKVRLDF
ncbi:Lpg1974 family pore-forming outer membrane protein [Candidatus Neptunochlamydia vexilliferae]|nr:Lpg1974 family pore-forming outer membrane protein [Candidatus Neptunochlamydia vexilliferae]